MGGGTGIDEDASFPMKGEERFLTDSSVVWIVAISILGYLRRDAPAQVADLEFGMSSMRGKRKRSRSQASLEHGLYVGHHNAYCHGQMRDSVLYLPSVVHPGWYSSDVVFVWVELPGPLDGVAYRDRPPVNFPR